MEKPFIIRIIQKLKQFKDIFIHVLKIKMSNIIWSLNTVYKLGDTIEYKDNSYKCIQPHTSYFEYGYPDQTINILWSNDKTILETKDVITLWTNGKAYQKGDIVKFDKGFYYCAITHLSNIINSPNYTKGYLWVYYYYYSKL